MYECGRVNVLDAFINSLRLGAMLMRFTI